MKIEFKNKTITFSRSEKLLKMFEIEVKEQETKPVITNRSFNSLAIESLRHSIVNSNKNHKQLKKLIKKLQWNPKENAKLNNKEKLHKRQIENAWGVEPDPTSLCGCPTCENIVKKYTKAFKKEKEINQEARKEFIELLPTL